MRLLVTRPEPDAARQAARLALLGHRVLLAPMLSIEFMPDVPLDLAGASAAIATSRNALRALSLHQQRDEVLRLPLFAVGEATAREAAGLGFAEIIVGPGTGEELASLILERGGGDTGTLLHLSGEIVAFDLKTALEAQGFSVRQPVLYRSLPATELPPNVVATIEACALDGIILMSPLTGSIFASLVRQQGLVTQMSRLVCYCLSGAVAEAVEPLGARLLVAARPREEDVLALLAAQAAS